jgi:hypothetical protein
MSQSAANRTQVEQEGGSEKYIAQLIRTIITPMQEHLLDCKPGEEPLTEPHIVSFTAPEDDNIKAHGLLSQWRGYGREGGFVIVFETAKLAELMHEFGRKYENSGDLFSGRVVYSDETDQQILEEFKESEGAIRAGILEYFRTGGNPKNFGQVYTGLVQCACRYKHWGFKEEREVRIVAIPNNKEVRELAKKERITTSEMPRGHIIRSGTPVPYLDLLKGVTSRKVKSLPIKRIIVGPHPDWKKRVRAVEIMLHDCGIDAPVSASQIPYIGT